PGGDTDLRRADANYPDASGAADTAGNAGNRPAATGAYRTVAVDGGRDFGVVPRRVLGAGTGICQPNRLRCSGRRPADERDDSWRCRAAMAHRAVLGQA